jgi:hypothetical protein
MAVAKATEPALSGRRRGVAPRLLEATTNTSRAVSLQTLALRLSSKVRIHVDLAIDLMESKMGLLFREDLVFSAAGDLSPYSR